MATALQFERDQNGTTASSETPRHAVRHFWVAEIAKLWNLSRDYVRRIFGKEPGVLVLRKCEEEDVEYSPVILRRKKELRGTAR